MTDQAEPLTIVFLDRSAIRTTLRPPRVPHKWIEFPTTPPDLIASRLAENGASVAIINRAPITRETLLACPKLKLVAVCATGFDTVDVAACKELGVNVCNVRDWAVSMPEHVFALILALRRQLLEYNSLVRSGEWGKQSTYGMLREPLPRAIYGSKMSIIGHGALGQKVGALAKAFGMEVLVAERKGADVREGRVDVETAIREADVLVVICPLTPDTAGLIGDKELRTMKPTSLLINVARGGIVSEPTLLDALSEDRLAGAALDVLSTEPPSPDNPLVLGEYKGKKLNVIVTPHMGWCSVESLEALGENLVSNIENWANGNPSSLVA